MSLERRPWRGAGWCAAVLFGLAACSGEAGRSGAKPTGKLDAALLGLLGEIDRSRDPSLTRRSVAKVLQEERFTASLLAVLANPADPYLVAAIRCAGAVPKAQLPAAPGGEMAGGMAGEMAEEPAQDEAATIAATWTDPDSPANARLEPLLVRHLQHKLSRARAAALLALAARTQLPVSAGDLLEDADPVVRAAAITACVQFESPPWPRMATAWLSLGPAQVDGVTLDPAAADELGGAVVAMINWNDAAKLEQHLPLLARLSVPETAITQLVTTLPRADDTLAVGVLKFLSDSARPLDDPQPVMAIVTDSYRSTALRQAALHCLESCEAPVVAELQQAMPQLDAGLRIAAARVMIRAGSHAGIDALCDVAQSGEESSRGALLLLSRLAGASASTPVEELRSRLAARDLRQLRLP